MDYSPYRSQITAIDLLHIALIMVVILVMLWLCQKCHATNDGWYALWVPPFTVTMLGLIMRLDTMVHRIGGFLLANGDPWELAKATHAPTGYLMPMADVLVLVPVIGLLVYAEVQSWKWFDGSNWRWPYLLGTSVLILTGVGGWILAALKAKTGFQKGA